jgi:hypothetical protein
MSVIALACAAALGLFSRDARTQTNTGEIEGVVVDAQGGVLPGADVTATHVDSGFRVERLADAAGRFFLPALPGGRYHVAAALHGFKTTTQRDIVVAAGQRLHLSLTLEIGQLTDTVTVTGVTPLLQTACSRRSRRRCRSSSPRA